MHRLSLRQRKERSFHHAVFQIVILTWHPLERGRPRFAHQFARIERLFAFHDVGQQNIDKRVLAIERRASLIFGGDESLDRCEVALAERVVLVAIKALPPSVGLSGIDPVVHDTPTDEPSYWLISVPPVKQQPISIVRAVVDTEFREFHDRSQLEVRLNQIAH
jgi:hypothetical protein